MCHPNAFVTFCHRDNFTCNPIIFVAVSFISSEFEFELDTIYRRHFAGGGGSLRDPCTLGPLGKHKCQGLVQLWGVP